MPFGTKDRTASFSWRPVRRPLAQAVRIPEDEGVQQLEMDLPCDGGVCFV